MKSKLARYLKKKGLIKTSGKKIPFIYKKKSVKISHSGVKMVNPQSYLDKKDSFFDN